MSAEIFRSVRSGEWLGDTNSVWRQHAHLASLPKGADQHRWPTTLLVGDGHGARRAGADDPPGSRQGSVVDPDREDEG